MIESFAIKGDDLEIGTVLERYQDVMAPHRMLSSRDDGKAEIAIILRRLPKILDDDYDMVNSLNHGILEIKKPGILE
jgi:hypothetical protein